jgi:rod shape-determining protein MreC
VIGIWRLLTRYRRAVVLATALVLAFLLMTAQVRQERAVVAFTRQAVLLVFSPFLKLTSLVTGGLGEVWQDYVDLRDLRDENLRLQREVGVLKRRLDEVQEQALEAQRLQQLLTLKDTPGARFLSARVVGRDATNWFKTLVLDRGGLDGVRRNQPVVAPDGLVGRVVEVTPTSAKVQLVTDPLSAVGGLIQRTRVTGIVTGSLGAGTRVTYLPLLADVVAGDQVLTSGMGGVFPKGIPVGHVTAVERRSGALFQEASLEPAVDLARLEEVLILTGMASQEGFEAGRGFRR